MKHFVMRERGFKLRQDFPFPYEVTRSYSPAAARLRSVSVSARRAVRRHVFPVTDKAIADVVMAARAEVFR